MGQDYFGEKLKILISPDKGLSWKSNNNMIFHSQLFPGKAHVNFLTKKGKHSFRAI